MLSFRCSGKAARLLGSEALCTPCDWKRETEGGLERCLVQTGKTLPIPIDYIQAAYFGHGVCQHPVLSVSKMLKCMVPSCIIAQKAIIYILVGSRQA